MKQTTPNDIIEIRERLLEQYIQNGGFYTDLETEVSVKFRDDITWVKPKEFFNPIELNILLRMQKEGSEALWNAIDVSKLEKALAIARSFKKQVDEEVA